MSVFSSKKKEKGVDVATTMLNAVFDELKTSEGVVSGKELKSVGFTLVARLDGTKAGVIDGDLSREEFVGHLAEHIKGADPEVSARLTKEAVQLVVKVHSRRFGKRLAAERSRLMARGPEALSDAERARIAELKAMAPEKQREVARSAMRDVLRSAIGAAVKEGTDAATWTADEELAIPMPRRHKFDNISAAVCKVPIAGKAAAAKVSGVADGISKNIAEAAVAICFDSRTESCYVEALDAWVKDVDDPAALGVGKG